jgi:hypothetical protein
MTTIPKTHRAQMRRVTREFARQKLLASGVPKAEAARIASAFAAGCPLDLAAERFSILFGVPQRERTPKAQAERDRRGRALRLMLKTVDKPMRAADDRERVENVLLRLRLAVDAGMVSEEDAAVLRADAERRLRQIKRIRRVN